MNIAMAVSLVAVHTHRGTTNESSYIPLIAQKVAEVTGESTENVMKVTTENALRIFDKIKIHQ